MKQIKIKVKNNEFIIGGSNDLKLIAGPCAIESLDHSMFMAEKINNICNKLSIKWIFKSCYDKDCRSSPDSFHGVGILEGLRILEKSEMNLIFQLHLIFLTQCGLKRLVRYVI